MLHTDNFPWKVICRLYALIYEIRSVVWTRDSEETVHLFTDRRYGILTFIDGFLQIVRFILRRTNMKIADTEPLSLDPSDMEAYVKEFDILLGDNPSDFLNELSQTDLSERAVEIFQAILDVFLTYNDLYGTPLGQDEDDLLEYPDEYYDDFYVLEAHDIDDDDDDLYDEDFDDDDDSFIDDIDDDTDDEAAEEEDERGIDPLYRAAYEQMTFRDSAEDGTDDETMDGGGDSIYRDGDDNDLTRETDRINDRLSFIYSIVRMWKFAAGKSLM
ncbi:MAG: hypothetical protein Q4G59_08170, partial [Planctomycetia bacterium]|nr:hypothetical protein [Planctomycetia bacterium]